MEFVSSFKRHILLIPVLSVFAFQAYAKKIEASAVLNNGETILVSVTGYKNGLISPFTTIRSEIGKHELSEISEIHFFEEHFVVRKIEIFEDSCWVVLKKEKNQLYKGKIKYRPCTCNNSFRISEAFVTFKGPQSYVIIKHHLKDKILKKRGVYTGMYPELEKELKPLNYRFSSIPNLF